jgi:NAD(P)-dependent dehydrogenase (short-subunit alcohol dehydrogenase family)
MSDARKPFGNKLVVVTGAGGGIGRATALGFAAIAEARVTYALSRLAPGALRALARLEAARSPVRRGRAGR